MPLSFDRIRRHALALEAVTEAPHHDYGSFRVRGKIFVTWPPDGLHLHAFVADEVRERALALHPDAVDKLSWGGKVVGLRVRLQVASADLVRWLVDAAYAARVAKDAGPPKRRRPADGKAGGAG